MSPSEYLQIDLLSDRPGRAVLVLRGELDHVTADAARGAVARAAADGYEEVVIDLSLLSFMDGGGLHLLYGLAKEPSGVRCSMVDGSDAAAHLLGLMPGPRPLPTADVDPAARSLMS